ncbi:MarR family winged helix-turn-helix transcriptional regulator [Phyllobacterium endophyticum]|uniref:MarR family transcriptional regulator n=1 Tax=Phyllobacterium endophyticum TaxID=1149773 RepID=A0A2P7ARM6_9HYPH|nr:MarR family transcriptional regulator [Phyllobacterium endophyticum]MBB3236539.1 DNA-binding MarR family transcriptional regulator [Phyllobacterium endophyticum]PSH56868.1 MarR family transcriptional regulator [Phyllobacterium endophyticum]TYR39543.1 MarR family transcriptional regulator [Phyllobacterium endophyticum]
MIRDEKAPPLVLENFIPYRLNKAAEAVSQRFARLYREQYGLTRPEWRTLATLGQFGTATATVIGTHSSMHKTKVSRAVLALEKRRWLRRKRDGSDRRIENLELTSAGRKAYAELAKVAHQFETELLAHLGKRGESGLIAGLAALERLHDSR